MPAMIEAKNLTLSYGENKVISSANFEIFQGDFICVVGANGSGKSTLVKAILGLINPRIGKIIYGEGVSRNTIGYFPQEFRVKQDFPATVYEIVLSGVVGRLGKKRFYRAEDKEKALDNLRLLNIEKMKDESFTNLSGGQKQKVLLARALVATSKLLILDEPSNNLDHDSRKSFYEILRELNAKHDITIIMITHDLDANDLIGDKILAIEKRTVKMYGTKEYLGSFR